MQRSTYAHQLPRTLGEVGASQFHLQRSTFRLQAVTFIPCLPAGVEVAAELRGAFRGVFGTNAPQLRDEHGE